MSFTSDEVNYLIYRYLEESGQDSPDPPHETPTLPDPHPLS